MDRRTKLLIALGAAVGLFLASKTKAGRTVIESTVNKLASLLTGEEGLRLTAYQDTEGNWTIGYGHKIMPADRLYPYSDRHSISQQEAETLRNHDMAQALGIVARYVHVPLTQNQQLALASLAYNIGEGQFAGSTLVKLLNAGDTAGAAQQFAVWNKITRNGVKVVDQILVNRRAREMTLFRQA